MNNHEYTKTTIKIRFIRDWKFSGGLHNPIGITKYSNRPYLVMKAVSLRLLAQSELVKSSLRSISEINSVLPDMSNISSDRSKGILALLLFDSDHDNQLRLLTA